MVTSSTEHHAGIARWVAPLALRRGLLIVAAAAAVTAVLAGLARLGVVVGWGPVYFQNHGPIFVLGVFCTVIGLERAVALGSRWGFLAPAMGALAAILMLAGSTAAPAAAALSSLSLAAVNGAIVRRQAAAFTWLMLVGSGVLLVGALLWAIGRPVYEVVATWEAFFVLTIVGERLELSRLAPTPRWASRVLMLLSAALVVAVVLEASSVGAAARVIGGIFVLIAAWQLRFDLARRTLRQPGLPRYAATGVLLGAFWLFVSGVLFASAELGPAGPRYDAGLHTVFIGYVLSMVFAHAPIIFPAVARLSIPYSPFLYVPLAALHLGLAARILGDIVDWPWLRKGGGVTNALSLAVFAVAVIVARRTARAG